MPKKATQEKYKVSHFFQYFQSKQVKITVNFFCCISVTIMQLFSPSDVIIIIKIIYLRSALSKSQKSNSHNLKSAVMQTITAIMPYEYWIATPDRAKVAAELHFLIILLWVMTWNILLYLALQCYPYLTNIRNAD